MGDRIAQYDTNLCRTRYGHVYGETLRLPVSPGLVQDIMSNGGLQTFADLLDRKSVV